MSDNKGPRFMSDSTMKINEGNLNIEIFWFRQVTKEGTWKSFKHSHATYEFHFVVSGSCTVITNDGEFVVNAGDFFLTAPYVSHIHVKNDKDRYLEYRLNCSFKLNDDESTDMENIFKILSKSPCKPVKDSEGIIELFNKAFDEVNNKRPGYRNYIKNIVFLIIVSSGRAIIESLPKEDDILGPKEKFDARFIKIQQFIIDNMLSPLTITDIAEYMHLSEKQVSRIVLKGVGVSTKAFINQLKLKRSMEILETTDYSIKQISHMLGFSTEFYFTRFFKREKGCSPSIFRKQGKNDSLN